VELWDGTSGAPLARHEHSANVTTAIFSPDGTRVASATEDGEARILELSTGSVSLSVRLPSAVRSVAFDRAGERLAVGTKDGQLKIVSLRGNGDIEFPTTNTEIRALAFNSDATRLVTGGSSRSPKRAP
jgi:WD40 repeat protein